MISPARIHPQLAFSSTEIISIAQIHPQLALFLRRDDFFRSVSSPACSFLPQRINELSEEPQLVHSSMLDGKQCLAVQPMVTGLIEGKDRISLS